MRDLNRWPPWAFLLAFAGLAVVLRAGSFAASVIDHDETTYLVIAQEILAGKTLYAEVWDTKPVGIFAVFAAVVGLFGNSVLAVRLFAAFIIGLTAWLLFLAARRRGAPLAGAALAGVAYPVLASLHKWTFAANAEIFFNLFTALALFFFLGKTSGRNFFLVGLAFGTGFLIKYFVLFDLAAFWLFHVWTLPKSGWREQAPALARRTAAMALGFALPFACVLAYYYFSGPFEAFWFTTFEVPGRYASGFDLLKSLNFLLEFHLVYLPFVLVFYLLAGRGADRPLARLSGFWMAAAGAAALLTGKHFLHYYFQLLLPLCFALSGLPGSGLRLESWALRPRVLTWLAAGLLAWSFTLQFTAFARRPDLPEAAAEYLKTRMRPADRLYCNQSTVLYFLLEKTPPTRYVHPTLLTKPEHIEAAGIRPEVEFQKIIGQKPRFFVLEKPVPPQVQKHVERHCRLERTLGGQLLVYRRVD